MGLRAACYRLCSEKHPAVFLLFPMIHIGTSEYYRDICSRLSECDVVLFEGVDSFRTRLLTTSYRWVTKRSRVNLETQPQGLKLANLPLRLVHADVTEGEFEQHWRKIPITQRAALMCLSPIYGFWLYLTASRESLGKHLDLEDLPSRDDTFRQGRKSDIEQAFLSSRDRKLLSCIKETMREADAPQTIGVVHGAAHIQPAL
ncbi:hypothetical protein [Rhodanobacter geophilus]|uniref:Uncharacterized protein n=1 Tax=Rhodanobacter geophilus TaxID=3162488 RepID=A0ABV3QN17_9GAMM